MKKWIIFLSVSCAICIIVFAPMFKIAIHDIRCIALIKKWKDSNNDLSSFQKELALTGTLSILMFVHFVFSAFMLITIVLRKIQPLSISENLAAWKEHHQQRKLEKAQAKVAQLQEELKKDDN